MTTPLEITDREATALADLTVTAPPSLRTSVLVEVGLADRYGRVDSPLGPLVVAWNGLGVVSVDIAGDDGAFEANHLASTGRHAIPSEVPQRLANAIARRLEGDRRVRIPLDLRGHSPFEQDVWKKALEIPRGEVRPYGWIAAEIGRPKAVRAVGTALGHNPVSIVVPCHRVLRTDGGLGGYALGLELKTRLLGLERETPALVGTDITRTVCRHGCSDEQRFSERHRVVFSSLREARAAGYRACRRCRPTDA